MGCCIHPESSWSFSDFQNYSSWYPNKPISGIGTERHGFTLLLFLSIMLVPISFIGGGDTSSPWSLLCEVSQGLMLSSFLFNIYMNPLSDVSFTSLPHPNNAMGVLSLCLWWLDGEELWKYKMVMWFNFPPVLFHLLFWIGLYYLKRTGVQLGNSPGLMVLVWRVTTITKGTFT